MLSVILDTNVIVSSMIVLSQVDKKPSPPYLIVTELFLESKITLCLSDDLLAEYERVLANVYK